MKKNNCSKIGEKIQKSILVISLYGNTAICLISIIAVMITGGRLLASNRADQITFIAVLLAVGVSFLISVLMAVRQSKRVSREIGEPISQLAEYADSIASGNLDIAIPLSTDDEIGLIAGSFRRTIASLQRMEKDVDILISEATKGCLDRQIDADHLCGEYRKIIKGVNQIFDAVGAPLHVASDFIRKLADGDHQNDIENTYKGHYAVLIENLNQVRRSVNILEDESDKLAEAGVNGNLDVRGDASKLKGVFSKVIDGINNTFDSIKAPLDAASEYIEKMANGEDLQTLDNPYKGYYAKLIDNLQQVCISLNILLNESSRLAEAGKSGDLGQRGDSTGLKGEFARIINGFNETIDSLAAPLNEAKVVLGKIAVNDYTVEMSGSYKGTLKEFAESINNVREHLLGIEKVVMEVSRGCGDSLDSLKNSGKRSENDKMIPSLVLMIQSIHNMVLEAERLASATIDGDLSIRSDESAFAGDYLHVIRALNRTMEAVDAPIKETSQVLQKLAQGNLTVEVTGEYKGEYNTIKTAMNQAVASFNVLLRNINTAASQVAAGSQQISDASQALAQGATEQASSVEELTAAITEIAGKTKQNAMDAGQASELSTTVQTQAMQGNEKMSQMLDSMREINDSSANISKIIKVIDDIAFQTNILALNASVEAARAGQYGKGFSVVAEEVRSLAAKSTEAAKNTTDLIEGSIGKIESGSKVANETADMLNKISESIQKAAALVGNIAVASNEQANAIAQIDQGIEQVSTVVQTNSATAEESAASSEELSGQANLLSELVKKFQLKVAYKNADSETQGKNMVYITKRNLAGPTPLVSMGSYEKY